MEENEIDDDLRYECNTSFVATTDDSDPATKTTCLKFW
jgi:hypothetical protein